MPAFAIYVDSMGRLSRAQRITWRTKVVDAIGTLYPLRLSKRTKLTYVY